MRKKPYEKKSFEENDQNNPVSGKPSFSLPQIKSPFPILKPSHQQHRPHPPSHVGHSDPRVVSLPRPYGPQLPESYDVYGLPSYRMPVPFSGYEPYYRSDMHHPGYDCPMPPVPHSNWYDYPSENYLGYPNQYLSMPAPQIPEMGQPPRADMSEPMVKHSFQEHIQPPFSAPVPTVNVYPSRKQSSEDEKILNIKPIRNISHAAEKELSPHRSRSHTIEKRHKVAASQPLWAPGDIPDNCVF